MPRVTRVKKDDDATPTIPLCPCKELKAEKEKADKAKTELDPELFARLKRQVWWCWNCQASDGCPVCKPRLGVEDLQTRAAVSTCSRCQLYMSALAFVLEAGKMPDHVFHRYPEGWRCEYWAVFDNTPKQYLPNVQQQLRNEAAFKRINRLRRFLDKPELVPIPEGEPVVDEEQARRMLREWLRRRGR